MALPSSGSLSLNQMHIEVGGTSGTQCSLNDSDIRGLIGKGSGSAMSFNEWYGASAFTADNNGQFTFGNSGYTSFKVDYAERGVRYDNTMGPNFNYGSLTFNRFYEMASGKKIFIASAYAVQSGSTTWNTSQQTGFTVALPLQDMTVTVGGTTHSIYGLGTSTWHSASESVFFDPSRLAAAGLTGKSIRVGGQDINATIGSHTFASLNQTILPGVTGTQAFNHTFGNAPSTANSGLQGLGLMGWNVSTSNSNRQNVPSSGAVTITLV